MKNKSSIIPGSSVDHEKWDQMISKSANEHLYGYSWFLNIVCPEWKALIQGDYRMGAILPIKHKLGIKYIYQPHLLQRTAVFGEGTEDFRERLKQEIQKFKWIDFTSEEKFWEPFKSMVNLILRPENVKWDNLSKNTKRNIGKFDRSTLEVQHESFGASLPEMIGLFRQNKGAKLGGVQEEYYHVLTNLVKEAKKRGRLSVYSVSKDGLIQGGIVVIHSERRSVLLFTAAGSEAKQTGAMHALVWKAIQEAKSENRTFDFEGSMHPGTARFYQSFGAEEEKYFYFRKRIIG